VYVCVFFEIIFIRLMKIITKYQSRGASILEKKTKNDYLEF